MAMSGTCIVYMATNTIDGKCYIGVTKQRLQKRMNEHFWCAKRNHRPGSLFHRALRKHGRESFVFGLLGMYCTYKAALDAEILSISRFQPEYNLTSGGEGNLGWVPSQKTRDRISMAKIGRPGPWPNGTVPPEHRKKMKDGFAAFVASGMAGKALKGRKRPRDVVEKIAAKRRGVSIPSSTPELRALRIDNMRRGTITRSIRVMCVDDGMVFNSAADAARHYGLNSSSLTQALRKGSSTLRGRVFRIV